MACNPVTIVEGEAPFKISGVDKECKTWYKVCGDISASRTPVVVVHGGPGLVHDYLSSLVDLAAPPHSLSVVFYDQCGNGRSTHLPEKHGDTTFWTEELFIAEFENLLQHLGIQNSYNVVGHSWGGMLMARYASRRPKGLRRLVLASAPASIPLWVESLNRLKDQLPKELQDVLNKHIINGTTDSPEYHEAITAFYARHACRLDPPPDDFLAVFDWLKKDSTVYETMYGSADFSVTGSLQDWSMINEAHDISVPVLLTNGRYDEAQDSVVSPYFKEISKIKWVKFDGSSHMPHWEERSRFMDIVVDFITGV